jgi:uncharacterized protein YhaN
LSVFEQHCFVDDKETTKEYAYPLDDENVEEMVEVLKYAAADSRMKREMEAAWWADQDEKEYQRMEKEIEEKDKEIEENKKTIAEKEREIAELKRQHGVK